MNSKSDLTREEQEILEAYERDEFVSVATPELRQELTAAARSTFQNENRVDIRLSKKDLELLQQRAVIEGISYQTLISSVLHKFVNGGLVDRSG